MTPTGTTNHATLASATHRVDTSPNSSLSPPKMRAGRQVGEAAWRLGAGRARKEDPVQASAGVRWHARPGDRVTAGQTLFELHTEREELIAGALEAIEGAWKVGEVSPTPQALVAERIG